MDGFMRFRVSPTAFCSSGNGTIAQRRRRLAPVPARRGPQAQCPEELAIAPPEARWWPLEDEQVDRPRHIEGPARFRRVPDGARRAGWHRRRFELGYLGLGPIFASGGGR